MGDTAWMLFATTFVMLQTPAAGVCQGGLVRRKNCLSLIAQSFAGLAIGAILWFLVGFSLTFGESWGGLIGNIVAYPMFHSISTTNCMDYAPTIPGLMFAGFQMMFALMVPVLITGAWAEKLHLKPALVFMTVWPFLVYYPVAHWVWNTHGWLAQHGVLDFAGGLTIHTTSGVAALVVATKLETRRGFHNQELASTHNLPLAVLGAALIWAGWFSFNGGSALRANFQAVSALVCTQVSSCVGLLVWMALEYRHTGYMSLTGMVSGALAGLAGVTPGSGYIHVKASVLFGVVCTACSYWSSHWLKTHLQLDDVLDVTSLQAVPGAVGSVLLGVFSKQDMFPCELPRFNGKPCNNGSAVNGVAYGGSFHMLIWQTVAVVVISGWTALMTAVTLWVCEHTVGIGISPEVEELGLDLADLGEAAYDNDAGETEEQSMALSVKLCDAASSNQVDAVSKYIKLGANAHKGDYDGRYPLHLAAAEGSLDVVKFLVRNQSVDINVEDRWGSTPLRDAARHRHKHVISWLKEQGANLGTRTADAEAELLAASASGAHEEVANLLASGVNPSAADYDGRTSLHLASSEGHEQVVEVLMASGADTTLQDRWRNVPYDDAERHRHTGVLTALLGDSAPRASLQDDQTVPLLSKPQQEVSQSCQELLTASSKGDVVAIKRLARKQVAMDDSDYDRRTALHLAAANGHLLAVQFLCSQPRVNVNAQDRFHNTPLMEAVSGRHQEIVDWLRGHGATITNKNLGQRLCQLSTTGDLKELEMLHSSGTNVDVADYDGRTAMHLAACFNQREVLKWLISVGAHMNPTDRWGGTPLQDALKANHEEVVALLVAAGAKEETKLTLEPGTARAVNAAKPVPVEADVVEGPKYGSMMRDMDDEDQLNDAL